MENQEIISKNARFRETLKQAAIAILIGAMINFVTIFSQAFLGWLQDVQPEVPGTLVGIAKYLHSWKTSHFG